MPKALVIDDEAALATIVGRFLAGADFDVETATSGPEGLRKAALRQPDVVIVDIMMPDMDGYEVCRRLRQDPRTARAAILVLTARGQLIDKALALRAGADAHVAKPFDGKSLVQQVQQLLAGREPIAPPLGYQILVLRLKEGAGATTLAANVALCLAREKGRLAVVADLMWRRGQIGNRLGLPPSRPWQETLGSDADELAEHLVRHESGLFALPRPPDASPFTPAQAGRALQTLREWYDYVVVDTPFNLGPLAPVLLKSSPLVLLLLTPDPAVMRTAQASVAAIRKVGSRALRIWPILSKRAEDPRFQQEAEEVLSLPVTTILPWSPEQCAQAVAYCRPVVLSYPDSPLAEAFCSLAEEIVQFVEAQS